MHEQLIETIEKFSKREIFPKIEFLESIKQNQEIISSLLKKTSEIGIDLIPLPEEAGGIGLNLPAIGAALRKISEVDAGIAAIFLFHYSGMFPFLMNEKGITIIREIMSKDHQTLFSLLQSSTVMNITEVKHVVIYSEKDEKAYFSLVPLSELRIIEKDRNLGLRPLLSATVSIENIQYDEKFSLSITVEEGRNLLKKTTSFVDIMLSSIAIGNAESALRHAFKYATERYQGGDIIIKHSIVQTMLGRILARIDGCSAYCERILYEAGKGDYTKSGLAKAFITENCEWACSDCVQIFGGYGYMKDFHVERHLRDAKTICAISGGNMFKLQEYVKTISGVKNELF
jgi:acyl-CoA dehydrogenase